MVECDWGVHVNMSPRDELTLQPWEEVHFTNEGTGSRRYVNLPRYSCILEGDKSMFLLPELIP